MRPDLESELRRILQAVQIQSANSFVIAGRTVSAGAVPFPVIAQSFAPPHPLTATLELELYTQAYCRKFGEPVAPPDHQVPPEDLLPALQSANGTADRWENGWEAVQWSQSGQVLARRHGLHRWFQPGDFVTAHGGGNPKAGTGITVLARRESTTWQPGFYFALSQRMADQQDDSRQVRFYWHVRATGAAALLADLTTRLNRFEVPFRCKCLTTSSQFQRADALVLFVARRHFPLGSRLLADVPARHAAHLQEGVPLFSRRLATGLGVAEDPGSGESFGMHRCRLLAEAIWQAHERGTSDEAGRLAAVNAQFQKAGINLAAPHLNPGSPDLYEWPSS